MKIVGNARAGDTSVARQPASTMKSEVGAVPGYLSTPLPCQPRVYTRPPPATIMDHADSCTPPPPALPLSLLHPFLALRFSLWVRAPTKLRGQRMHAGVIYGSIQRKTRSLTMRHRWSRQPLRMRFF